MRRQSIGSGPWLGFWLALAAGWGAAAAATKMITADDASTMAVETGELRVPESRDKRSRRELRLPYYRVRSTAAHPAAPIFLLAGGPGSSWLDQVEQAENFQEVIFYRSIADVVLFDQRGGGRAQPAMDCPQSAQLPADQPLDKLKWREQMRALLTACRDQWQQVGVDLAAYNTDESAADVDALRRALGYRKITLIGGSYGSHLALHMMRRYPRTIDRAVLFGIEGPDHTWDDPAARLATLERIASDAEGSGALTLTDGGILQVLARVLKRLDTQPQRVTVTDAGATQKVVVDAALVRRIAGHRAGRRNTPLDWPEMILAMDRGDFSLPARGALALRQLRLDRPMHYSMDCASGISAARRQRYHNAAATALLGDINAEYESLCDLWPHRDLGAVFRANVISSTPTLILHGTWDMSTPIENAQEVMAGLSDARFVRVIGGSHGVLYNLYAHWPPMHERMRAFLTGQQIEFPATVVMPPVVFPNPPATTVSARDGHRSQP